MTRLWLRADGAPGVGIGHVGRSVSLGVEAVSRGLSTVLVTECTPLPTALLKAVRSTGIQTREPEGAAWTTSIRRRDLVWFDGYGFTVKDREPAHRVGAVVGAVDDVGTGEADLNVVLNPNVALVKPVTSPGKAMLLGPSYALINSGLSSARQSTTRSATTLLVTFGGSDPAELGPAMIRTFERRGSVAPFRRAVLVEGPYSAPVGPRPVPADVEVLRDPPDMARVLEAADAAVSAAGSTIWDLLYLGVPTVAIQVAANQAGIVRTLRETGAGIVRDGTKLTVADLDDAIDELSDDTTRERLTQAGQALVDGRDAERVLDALLERSGH